MHLNAQDLQYFANLMAVEFWFDAPLPARLRNALAMRDFTNVQESTRIQKPNQLRGAGYLKYAPDILRGERGYRTVVDEAGKAAVKEAGTKTNLTEDEIEANIRAFGFEPMEGVKNAKRPCSNDTPAVWISPGAAEAPNPTGTKPGAKPTTGSDNATPKENGGLTREENELLEDLRAEYEKESTELDEVRRQAESIGAEIRPVRRRARFLDTLLVRYSAAADRMDRENPAHPGLANEIARVREELHSLNDSLVGLNEGRLTELESRTAVLACVTDAIVEAIAAVGRPAT